MIDWTNQNLPEISNTFDNDYNSKLTTPMHHEVLPINQFSTYNDSTHEIMQYQDPLKYSQKFQFKPLQLENIHFVKPHYVDSYVRSDGTVVQGYFRDGDGDTSVNRTVEQGGGYFRSNPDDNPFNNLK
ncbi:hypothetical protein [Alkalihalobacterium sp. APHAB7]|uniref:hypothetical protein n=1 Tax=Alkalihalobacterium sp. APHAB7 TaxID=3402081 RepID=UPI003AB0AF36